MAIDYKKLAAQAAENTDHNETTAGGDFERHLIPAGQTLARFIEYIELGVQDGGEYLGKKKPDVATVRLTFELLGKKNLREIEDDKGNKRTIADRYSKNIGIKLGDLATFKKYYNAMKYGRDDIGHMSQMLNEVFILEFTHKEGKDRAGKDTTYVNLGNKAAGTLGINSPFRQNLETGETVDVTGSCPPAISPIKIFLYDNPTKETWDSLHIEGTRTKKDANGKEYQESKNWLQEKILQAKDFTGSPLEDLLTGSQELAEAVEAAESKPVAKKQTTTAPTAEKTATKAAPATKSPSKEVVKKAGVTPKVAAAKSAKAAPADVDDPLAALGLSNV